jgi:hypothetical protein
LSLRKLHPRSISFFHELTEQDSGVNIVASAYELVHYITVTESKVVFCDSSAIGKVQEAIAMLPKNYAKPTVVGLGERGSLSLSV